jgi:MFS transporter, DHA1 family, inner membrane transport protein
MRKSFHWSPRPHKRHTWSDREGSDVSAIQDQSFPKPTTASAASLNQIAVAGTVALLGISYMFNSMDRQVFPALLSAIIPQDGLTLPQAGFVSTAFTVMVAIFGALSGWFMARFGRKAVQVGGLFAYSIFTLITPFATGFTTLSIYRTLTGAGEALQVGAVYACLGGYFAGRRGTFMGMVQAFFGLGALLGPVVGARLFVWSGAWQIPFYVFGATAILVALLIATAVPREFSDASESAAVTGVSASDRALSALPSRNVLIVTAAFFLVGTSFFSYTSLYATYLHDQLGFSIFEAGTSLGMYGVGALGGVFGGWLGERLGRLGVLTCLLVLAASGFALFNLAVSASAHAVLSLIFGLMISGFLFARLMSVLQLSAHPDRIGAVVAFGLGGFYTPGPCAGYLFGKLVVLFGWGAASIAMVALPALSAAALMSLFDMRKMRAA